MDSLLQLSLSSTFGRFSIVWKEGVDGPRVQRVVLSKGRTSSEKIVRGAFGNTAPGSDPTIAELGDRIARFLEGVALSFELDLVALEICSDFQRRVILAEHGIPRGMVSTYGRIARHIGVEGAARAVGSALARNPFPIVIPCHRAVLSDGKLGGYQGGPAMKRALLELEGVEVSESGKVITDEFYY